jgi:acetyl esterase/lipase
LTEPETFLDRLDDEHRRLLEMVPSDLLDISNLDLMRTRTDELMATAATRHSPVTGVAIEDVVVPGAGDRPDLPMRFYLPAKIRVPQPTFLYIHGGGYVSTKIEHYDVQCAQIAAGAGLAVASIDYRLSPEHPHPVPLEDSYAALAWLHDNAAERGLDPLRIGIGGTSAGAGIAAGLALLTRDRGDYPVAYQYLEAPMLDHRNITASSNAISYPKVWHRHVNQLAWAAYLGADHLERPQPPYASAAIASDLFHLPAAYLCVAAYDLFLDETIDYARRLIEAGVSVQLNVYEMGFHGSPRVLPSAAVSKRWKADSLAALRRLAGTDNQL